MLFSDFDLDLIVKTRSVYDCWKHIMLVREPDEVSEDRLAEIEGVADKIAYTTLIRRYCKHRGWLKPIDYDELPEEEKAPYRYITTADKARVLKRIEMIWAECKRLQLIESLDVGEDPDSYELDYWLEETSWARKNFAIKDFMWTPEETSGRF